jgi:hypothetical protein
MRLWNTMDVTGVYQITERVSASATLPIVVNKAGFLEPPLGPGLGIPQKLNAAGIGDLLLIARSWVVKPNHSPRQNLSFGVGLKLPTGNWRVQDIYADATGRVYDRKPVPLTIMPGDGGIGIYVEGYGFKSMQWPVKGSTYFAYGNYVITPQNTTNTISQITTSGQFYAPQVQNALLNTIPDTYSTRAGVLIPSSKKGWPVNLGTQLAFRWDGSPQRDFIGQSDGFRQPGWFMAFEPGIVGQYKRHQFSVTMPVTFVRNALPNLAEGRNSPAPRTTAFSPFSLSVRYGYAF